MPKSIVVFSLIVIFVASSFLIRVNLEKKGGNIENDTMRNNKCILVHTTGNDKVIDQTYAKSLDPYFFNLKPVDAIGVKKGESAVVGKVDTSLLAKMTPREIVLFLLDTEAIGTYWHIGAELCMVKEKDYSSHYVASFVAEHTFFTNEKNVEQYSFDVQIDKLTGTIAILVPSKQ